MRLRFLQFSFFALMIVLWGIFTTGVGLSYWTPMRTWQLPFTISPLEWTAFWSYVAALLLVCAFHLTADTPGYLRLWYSVIACAVAFMATALVLEYSLFFNARDPEKTDTPLIIIGCIILAIMAGIFGSLCLAVLRAIQKRKPNHALHLTADRAARLAVGEL